MRASDTTKKEELRKRAQSAFLREEGTQHIDRRIVEDDVRQMANKAKTAGLRELRLARDEASAMPQQSL
jgi:hypothetical protein